MPSLCGPRLFHTKTTQTPIDVCESAMYRPTSKPTARRWSQCRCSRLITASKWRFTATAMPPKQIRLRISFAHRSAWRDISTLSDEPAAELIRRDRIDILLDLTMHMKDNRLLLFAPKPAPIQVTWAYPGTTGLTAMDYRLTDPYLDPTPGTTDAHYSEHRFVCPIASGAMI